MKEGIKIFPIITIVLILMFQTNYAQTENDSTNHHMMKKNHTMMNQTMHDSTMGMQNMDSSKMMNHKMMGKKSSMKKDPIIREGVIDLQAIDENKDGKVYQDLMDFNVISDKPGKCPLCGMTLKETSLEKAKETLLKNGFKIKQ